MLPRRAVKLALCGDSRAKDANIRQALIDRFGGSAAVGRKAAPGPLYGISRDVWSALAIAVTYSIQGASEQRRGMNEQGGRQVVGAPVVDGRTGSVNVVVLALVAALLDLEQRRNRGKVRPPMDRDRSA